MVMSFRLTQHSCDWELYYVLYNWFSDVFRVWTCFPFLSPYSEKKWLTWKTKKSSLYENFYLFQNDQLLNCLWVYCWWRQSDSACVVPARRVHLRVLYSTQKLYSETVWIKVAVVFPSYTRNIMSTKPSKDNKNF